MAQPTVRDLAHSLGRQAATIANSVFNLFPAVARKSDFILDSDLPRIAGAALTEDTAYFVYLGCTSRRVTAKKVLFQVTTGGTGAQTAEVGVYSSPTAPNRAGQVLTKLAATDTLGDLTGTGVLGNTTDFNVDVPAGTHLWAAIRTAMATNEPQIYGVTGDKAHGRVLTTATAGALTSTTTRTGAVPTAAVTWQAPDLTLHVS